MYALIVPASAPLVLLAAVMALSWWEDRILPAPPADAPPEAPAAPATPGITVRNLELAELTHADTALAGEAPGS